MPLLTSNVFAASCYGSSCHGYNPASMGCGSDARTVWQKTVHSARIQDRNSPICNAEWERTKNISGGYRYAAGSIKYGCSNYCYHFSVSSPDRIKHGRVVYTHMVGPASTTPTKPCGRVSMYGQIGTPLTYYCRGSIQ